MFKDQQPLGFIWQNDDKLSNESIITTVIKLVNERTAMFSVVNLCCYPFEFHLLRLSRPSPSETGIAMLSLQVMLGKICQTGAHHSIKVDGGTAREVFKLLHQVG